MPFHGPHFFRTHPERHSERSESGLHSYFKASSASRLRDAVEHVFPNGKVNVVGYTDVRSRPEVEKIHDVKISSSYTLDDTRKKPMRVTAGSYQALLALLCMKTHNNPFRLDVQSTTRLFRVTHAALMEAIRKRCLSMVKASQPPTVTHRKTTAVKSENRSELGIPDDSEEDLEWLSYRGIQFNDEIRQWSISTSKFGPRSGISDAHRMRRAIMLGITSLPDIKSMSKQRCESRP